MSKQLNRKIRRAFTRDTKVAAQQVQHTVEAAVNKVEDVFTFNKRRAYPPILKQYVDQYGEQLVTGGFLYRHKVNQFITSALNVISGLAYDTLFHLRSYWTLANGTTLFIEKNERINCGIGQQQAGADTLPIQPSDIPPGLTFGALVDNTIQYLGSKAFVYSSYDANCQHWTLGVVTANHIAKPEYVAFIKQDTEAIFKGNAGLRKLANTVTDIAAEANGVWQGGAIARDGPSSQYFKFYVNDELQFYLRLDARRCRGTSRNGQQCRRSTVIGCPFCRDHLKSAKHLEIKPSTIPNAGLGLFAYHPAQDIVFREGDTIVRYEGEAISRAELQDRYGDKTAPYAFSLSTNRAIDAAGHRGIGSLANRAPPASRNNATFTSTGLVKATRNIRHGQEIFLAYGPSYRLHETSVRYATGRAPTRAEMAQLDST